MGPCDNGIKPIGVLESPLFFSQEDIAVMCLG